MRKVVLALIATFALTCAAEAQTNNPWADKLFGGTITHDFGTVPRGTQLKFAFKISNIYKVPLDITDVRVSCGCVRAEPEKKHLEPNETALVNVSMDARQFSGQKTVRVFITVGPKFISTAVLTLSANARGDVVFTPHDVDFGTIQHGVKAAKFIDVEYTGNAPDWRVTEIVKSASAPFDLKVEDLPRSSANGPPRRGYRITATVKPDAPGGSFKQEVILKTSDPASAVHTFNIVGHVQAGLAVSPSPVVVNGLRVGEILAKKVVVRASRPFRIIGIEGQGGGVSVDIPNRQEAVQILTINLAPTQPGEIRRPLTIRTDMGNEATTLMVEAMIEP